MAAWTAIDVNSRLPGEPWTSAKVNAVYENPTAIAEGSTGAPKIRGLAIAKNSDLPVLTVTAADTYSLSASVDVVLGTTTTTSTTYVELTEITIVAVTGTARFSATHYASSVSSSSDIRVKKNGVVENTWSTASGTPVSRSIDITIIPGDVISWEHRGVGSSPTSVADADVGTASDAYTFITPIIQSSLA